MAQKSIKNQLKKIKKMVGELLIDDLNDISVASTIGYIESMIDSLEDLDSQE